MRYGEAFERLVEVMARLRAPDGCPWDREQTLASLRQWLLEETYEVLEAIDGGDPETHRDELGDLLLQVVFQARIREEEGAFDVADVADAITAKMRRRHPHVFGDERIDDAATLKKRWSELKAEEKGRDSALDGIPPTLPALLRALRVGQKASAVGFDWPEAGPVLGKLDEESAELREAVAAGDRDATHDEAGDYLFTIVNLCRHLGVDPEAALQDASGRFDKRFRRVESTARDQGHDLHDLPIEDLEARWQRAKREVG